MDGQDTLPPTPSKETTSENYPQTWLETIGNRRSFPPLVKEIHSAVYQGGVLNERFKLTSGKAQHHHVIPVNLYLATKRDSFSTQVFEMISDKFGNDLMNSDSGKLLRYFLNNVILHPHDPLNCMSVLKANHKYFDQLFSLDPKITLDSSAYLLAMNAINFHEYLNLENANWRINGFSTKQRIAFSLDSMDSDLGGNIYGHYSAYEEKLKELARRSRKYLEKRSSKFEA